MNFTLQMKHRLSLFFILLTIVSFGQKSTIYAGPIVGSVTQNSAKVWLGYSGAGKQILVLTDTVSDRIFYPVLVNDIRSSKGKYSAVATFTKLEPNREYFVVASVEQGKQNATTSFTTLSDTSQRDFSFVLGSCAMMQTGMLRGIFPGTATRIFPSMEQQKANFMLWLGDNVYYLGRDSKTPDNMFERNMRVRAKFKRLNHFLSSVPQYAIWDDHDFGKNNSDKSCRLKDTALVIFKHFWANTYPQQDALKGNYFSFRKYDCEFLMMDCRYFREEPCDTCAFLGETQLAWLKNKLQLSDAAFKFIAIGTQVLNTNKRGESYEQYTREVNDLLGFITKNNIKGVVFLTGDKHFTELCKKDVNHYPIYDFTCSPLTSVVAPRETNPFTVSGSKYYARNFGKISISGEANNRKALLEVFSARGKQKFSYTISQSELQREKVD